VTSEISGGSTAPTPDHGAVMSALVTEHFVLQSAASSTISESGSRASIYLATLSSGLVAIGFSSNSPGILAALVFTVFPTVFTLGSFTVVRLIDTSVTNVVAQNRIERIRRYYAGLDPAAAHFFPADNTAVLGTMGVKYGRSAMFFTTASMVAVVNSVVGGAGLAVMLAVGGILPSIVAGVTGAAFGIVVLASFLTYQTRRFTPVRPTDEKSA
jgi:hypothetical protein